MKSIEKMTFWKNPLDKGLNPITMWEKDRIQEQNNNNDDE